jgi:hypothetical protein
LNLKYLTDFLTEKIEIKDNLAYRADILKERSQKKADTGGRFDSINFSLDKLNSQAFSGEDLNRALDTIIAKLETEEDGETKEHEKTAANAYIEAIRVSIKEGDTLTVGVVTNFIYGDLNNFRIMRVPENVLNFSNLYLPKEAEKFIRKHNIQNADLLDQYNPRANDGRRHANEKMKFVGVQNSFPEELIDLGYIDEPHREKTIYRDYIVIVPTRASVNQSSRYGIPPESSLSGNFPQRVPRNQINPSPFGRQGVARTRSIFFPSLENPPEEEIGLSFEEPDIFPSRAAQTFRPFNPDQ